MVAQAAPVKLVAQAAPVRGPLRWYNIPILCITIGQSCGCLDTSLEDVEDVEEGVVDTAAGQTAGQALRCITSYADLPMPEGLPPLPPLAP